MAIHRLIFHNGRIRDASEPMLVPGQIGLLSGWGVFSTLRVADGVLFAWERHWARMSHDAELLNVAMPWASDDILRGLTDLIEANGALQATLRLVVVRNEGGMWEGPGASSTSDIIGLTADSNQWGKSVRLRYQPAGRYSQSDFATAKMLSWCANLRWVERAHELGFDECILLNERGEVCECTSANIFAVHGNVISTPPVASGCLPGVTRDVLLHEVKVPGFNLVERVLMPADLETASELFITSTTRDLLPVSAIGDKVFKVDGPVRVRVQDAFADYVRAYIAAHRLSPAPAIG